MPSLSLHVEPADALIDVARRITVSGAQPGAIVRIGTQTLRSEAIWTSRADFLADAQGRVDLSRDAPIAGDYSGVAPMGLIWSQTCADSPQQFNRATDQPLETAIVAQCSGVETTAHMVQRLLVEGVSRHEVREDGLVGVLYRPPGSAPAPAIMILNGSGGGINEPRAALWAAHGYNAMALGYFGAPGLPRYISNTPLEYFATGLDWLRANVQPRNEFVAVTGQSRGGELSLLLGATFPEKVSAVIAYVPSAFVHGGQAASDPAIGRDGPTWLLDGKPLTHIWDDNKFASWLPYDNGEPPRRNSLAMMTALADPQAVKRARIAVERIAGPVMLVSGGDDGAWPSDLFSLMVKSSLEAAGHPYPVDWVNYPEAGHSVLFPHVPTTRIAYAHPVSGVVTTMGGSASANAEANERSWAAVLKWVEEAEAAVSQARSQ